eukprot:EC799131.1.p2 GENE.EC799131.1~~EC799131.1.p2  ORF type:complete len:76 (+),score=20.41 EC799131.1:85-312(+)
MNAGAQYWRAAGMTYLRYANLCAHHVRQVLKEPLKTESQARGTLLATVQRFEGGTGGKKVSLDGPVGTEAFKPCP